MKNKLSLRIKILSSLIMMFMLCAVTPAVADIVFTDSLPSGEQVLTAARFPTIVYILLGLAVYFTARFRMKRADEGTAFDWKVWLNKNWFNVMCYLIAVVWIVFAHISFSPIFAFMLGAMPNLLIDWVKKEFFGRATPTT